MTEVITVLRSFAIVISASMKSLAGLILRQTVAGQAGSRRHPVRATRCEQLTCTPFTREGFGCLETMPHVKSSR